MKKIEATDLVLLYTKSLKDCVEDPDNSDKLKIMGKYFDEIVHRLVKNKPLHIYFGWKELADYMGVSIPTAKKRLKGAPLHDSQAEIEEFLNG